MPGDSSDPWEQLPGDEALHLVQHSITPVGSLERPHH